MISEKAEENKCKAIEILLNKHVPLSFQLPYEVYEYKLNQQNIAEQFL